MDKKDQDKKDQEAPESHGNGDTSPARHDPQSVKGIRGIIDEHPVTIYATVAIAAFVAGFLVYGYGLTVLNYEPHFKGSCIPIGSVYENVNKEDTVENIQDFINEGRQLENSHDKAKMAGWIKKVIAFIHGIKLEKDAVDSKGQKMSAIELDIRNTFVEKSIEIQVQHTIEILEGFRKSVKARISRP